MPLIAVDTSGLQGVPSSSQAGSAGLFGGICRGFDSCEVTDGIGWCHNDVLAGAQVINVLLSVIKIPIVHNKIVRMNEMRLAMGRWGKE